jgi:hypothetical protein
MDYELPDAVLKLGARILETEWTTEHGDKVGISASEARWLAQHIAEYVDSILKSTRETA